MTYAFYLARELGLFALGVLMVIAVAMGALLAVTGVRDKMAARSGRPRAKQPSEASRLRGRMRRLARPTLLLVPGTAIGFSKLGGDPDLPANVAWPEVRGRPYSFLGQVDLGVFQPHAQFDWLPSEGLFFAFVDLDGYGFADQVQVRFHAGPPGEPRFPLAPGVRFPERRVAFERYTSLPSLDWLGVDLAEGDLDEDELDDLAGLPDAPFGDEIQHRVGGYPSEIQDEQMGVACELIRRDLPPDHEVTPAIRRASRAWRLLFQIDSDPALNMNWGDGGRLYVFVREQDAKTGDFSQTITLSQTY